MYDLLLGVRGAAISVLPECKTLNACAFEACKKLLAYFAVKNLISGLV